MKKIYAIATALAMIFVSACVPVETPTDPAPTTPTHSFTLTYDLAEESGLAARMAARAAQPAATFHLVDVDPETQKVTKHEQIDNASDNGDGSYAVVINSNPNANSLVIVHNNANAPTIVLNEPLPDDVYYAPVTDDTVHVDPISTLVVDSVIDEGLTTEQMDTIVETVQAAVTPPEHGGDVNTYLNLLETIVEPEISSALYDAAEIANHPMNDTGVTGCGDYAYDGSSTHNTTLDCSNQSVIPTVDTAGAEYAADGGDVIPPAQDALAGRDVTHNDDSDGHAGFSYTKLDANGDELAASAGSWRCVRDNVTGYVWEVKPSTGIGNKDDRYTWSDPNIDPLLDTGDNQYTSGVCAGRDINDPLTWCNTYAYVNRVNSEGMCGYNDWKLPSTPELMSIRSFGRSAPGDIAIDLDYFPNTIENGAYLTRDTYARFVQNVRVVVFTQGVDGITGKTQAHYIRLVRY